MRPPKRRFWLWRAAFVVVIAALGLTAYRLAQDNSALSAEQPGLYPVSNFIDGDTIAVNMNGSVETIRFIGVDTPETHKPNTPVQCYGEAAAAYTKRLIGGHKVRLQADSLDTNRDRYGRLLRYVYLPDGTLVDESLIANGYGFAYTDFPFEKSMVFRTDEQNAKVAGRGLWSACQVKVESNGRRQTNPAS